jgi:hypothetical protein
MKFIKFIVPLFLVFAIGASGQVVTGPASSTGLTSNMVLVSTATTNFAISPWVKYIPVGVNGVGVAVTLWSPVALSATNCQWLFQGSNDGTNWITTPATAGAINFNGITPAGTTLTTSYTNFFSNQGNNLGNLKFIRPSWFTNQNGTNWIYVSNITWTVKF